VWRSNCRVTPTANPTYFVLAGRAAIESPSLPGTSAFTLIESYRSKLWVRRLRADRSGLVWPAHGQQLVVLLPCQQKAFEHRHRHDLAEDEHWPKHDDGHHQCHSYQSFRCIHDVCLCAIVSLADHCKSVKRAPLSRLSDRLTDQIANRLPKLYIGSRHRWQTEISLPLRPAARPPARRLPRWR